MGTLTLLSLGERVTPAPLPSPAALRVLVLTLHAALSPLAQDGALRAVKYRTCPQRLGLHCVCSQPRASKDPSRELGFSNKRFQVLQSHFMK